MLNITNKMLLKLIINISTFFCISVSAVSAEQATESAVYNFKVKDHQSETCETIFQEQDRLRITNASYWIRMLECASEYSSTENRLRAKSYDLGVWPDAFSWIILISNANPSINERKKMIHLFQVHDVNIPNNIRSLTNVILQLQSKELLLVELAESQDSEFIALTDTVTKLESDNAVLAKQLADTKLKLEHLADVEMQLSLRRQLQNQIEPTTENPPIEVENESHEQNNSLENDLHYIDVQDKAMHLYLISPLGQTQIKSGTLPLGPYHPIQLSENSQQLNWYLPLVKNSTYLHKNGDVLELINFLLNKP